MDEGNYHVLHLTGLFFFFIIILFCRILCLTPTSCNDALVPITRALCFVEKGD